jgi:hypothetical protein
MTEALAAARRRRRHSTKRAVVNVIRGSKWLLKKVPNAAQLAQKENVMHAGHPHTLSEASSG